jgi:hypothetical protein
MLDATISRIRAGPARSRTPRRHRRAGGEAANDAAGNNPISGKPVHRMSWRL